MPNVPMKEKIIASAKATVIKVREFLGRLELGNKINRTSQNFRIGDRIRAALPRKFTLNFPTSNNPAEIASWFQLTITKFLQQGGAQKKSIRVGGMVATLVLSLWFLADIVALLGERFIPDPPTPKVGKYSSSSNERLKSPDDFAVIWNRNLFNSKGLLPGEAGEAPVNGIVQDPGGAPSRSSLPFTLIGTLVLSDELRSIATIEDKTAQIVFPVRIQDEIPGKVKILSIEPRKVIFLNLSAGRREFIDLPEDASGTTPKITLGTSVGKPGAPIERLSQTQFNVPRTEIDKAMSNISMVLTQARAVPNFENGAPAGFRLFQIVPGSIYETLGLINGDVLCGVNGDEINEPGKAFELLNTIKTSSHLELCVKRDGKKLSQTYDIR